MGKPYLDGVFYLATAKNYWQYLSVVLLILIALLIFKAKPVKSIYVVDALISMPVKASATGFTYKLDPALLLPGNDKANIHDFVFSPDQNSTHYKLSFKTNIAGPYRTLFLDAVNKEIGRYVKLNEVAINSFADSLLSAQEKLENQDSIEQSQTTKKKDLKLSPPIIVDRKKERIITYLKAYLNKPIASFTLIPDGFATSKSIAEQILQFNRLQYRRQLILGQETSDKNALTDVTQAITDTRQQLLSSLSAATADAGQKPGKLQSVDTIKTGDKANVAIDTAHLSRKIALLQNKIAGIEAQNTVLAKPAYYEYYKETISTPRPLSWLYVVAAVIALTIPFGVSALRRNTGNSSVITTKGLIANYHNPSLILPNDTALRNEALITFLTNQQKALDATPVKDNLAKVVLITDATASSATANRELMFAKQLVDNNKRLLMIDCSTDEPLLLESLGIAYKHGLKEFLNKEISIAEISLIASEKLPGISFIGAGPISRENGADLMNFMNMLKDDSQDESADKQSTETVPDLISDLVEYHRSGFNYVLLIIPDLDFISRDSRLFKFAALKVYFLDDRKREIVITEA